MESSIAEVCRIEYALAILSDAPLTGVAKRPALQDYSCLKCGARSHLNNGQQGRESMANRTPVFAKKPLAAAIGALAIPTASVFIVHPAVAQTQRADNEVLEMLVVTATRRSESIQDVPLNITAVGGQQIQQQGLKDLSQLASWVPGIHLVDQGGRASDRIVARGLNADPSAASELLGNGAGEIVSTYVGEVPMYVNLKLIDLERVEVLLGPQGTLYGVGTMGGAIRYIPAKPEFDRQSFVLRGDAYTYSESDDAGGELGFTANLPISDTLSFRGSVDYTDDPGFIDYPFLVRAVGVSNPDPDITDPDAVNANLKGAEDVNDEETWAGRTALRWQPNDRFDATLTYYFQFQEFGGRQITHKDSFAGVDDYESALRVEEPNDRDNELFSLELTADLGFAELTSATGYSEYSEEGSRDQTDLLISLELSYEAFPEFSAFTREDQDEDTFSQEIRLVSTGDSRLNWIAGAFYSDKSLELSSKEFTPNFDLFILDQGWGTGLGVPRPDSLEYFAVQKQDLTETALYGELSYDVTDDWQVTLGTRWYDYDFDTDDAVDFPLYYTSYIGDRGPDEVIHNFESGGDEDDGFLFKFNTSYHFNEDMMGYLTVSEGYRIGSSNGLFPCDPNVPLTGQSQCGLPNELAYKSDQTTNYEIGLRTEWPDQALRLNGALYFIEWDDPQLAAVTESALLPIIVNGKSAETYGGELDFDWAMSDNWSVRGNYSYTKAELTDDVPNLIASISPPGFATAVEDGKDGDRLPGSPEHKGSLYVTYERPLPNGWQLELNYGVTAISDVLTRTGDKGGGDELDGYTVHTFAAHVHANNWTVTLYSNNFTDEYGETAARDTSLFAQQVPDINGDAVNVRRYYKNVIAPRSVGLRVRYEFEN
jgi:outer membrane receptor protein involved in Fe transport